MRVMGFKVKVLLTGHKGYIGTVMKHHLESFGYDVTGFDMNGADPGSFPDVSGFNRVIHLGAISNTEERNVDKLMHFNHDFSCKLLIACSQAGVDLQYASSASVFGNEQNNRIYPLNPYAWSKYLFDRLVEKNLSIDKLDIKVQGFRLFNVWGVPEVEKHKGPQASVMTQYHDKEKVKLFKGSEEIFRDFIHVTDVVGIIIEMGNINKSGIWELGSGTQKTFLDVGNVLVNSSFYSPTEIEWVDFPEHLKGRYQYNTKCYNAELLKVLGPWEFRHIEEQDDPTDYLGQSSSGNRIYLDSSKREFTTPEVESPEEAIKLNQG